MSWFPSKKASAPAQVATWADGTDAEIAALLAKHYAGEIDIHDFWTVGDERVVHLSAMEATGVGESHAAQDVVMVLMNAGGKTLTTPINGISECAFIVGQRDVLTADNTAAEVGYINSTNTTSGGWDQCARRSWCNNVYRMAIPETLRGIFKQHKNVTANDKNTSSTTTSDDYFALPAEKEVQGSNQYANATAESSLSCFDFYKTITNRVKIRRDSVNMANYWLRSPTTQSYDLWVYMSSANSTITTNISTAQPNSNRAISPFGVI